jgi:two-component sensor histidine kinase
VDQGVRTGLAVLRVVGCVWMIVALVLSRGSLSHPVLAISAVAVAVAYTAITTRWLREPPRLRRPQVVSIELAIGVGLNVAGGWAYRPGPPSSLETLGTVWPLAGVLAAGLTWGPLAGGAAGGLIGAARIVSAMTRGLGPGREQVFSLASTMVLYAVAGAVIGFVTRYAGRLERRLAAAAAREDVARTLHDGVLQVLCAIERRTSDADLARLARTQERELRDYLYGARTDPADAAAGQLAQALRQTADRVEDTFGTRVNVVVAPDLPQPKPGVADALIGAIGEAVTNAAKHGAASAVTVYVEPDGSGVFAAIHDDGCGFDPREAVEGAGLTHSIRGRVAEAGGRVELESRPGVGTEVRLWVP